MRPDMKTINQQGPGDKRTQGSTQWPTLPASCHPMRGRLRPSNCLPRWTPTGSLPGCSHAKWLQMRGMIRCWLRAEQNLPGNLATACGSLSLCSYLSWTLDNFLKYKHIIFFNVNYNNLFYICWHPWNRESFRSHRIRINNHELKLKSW